jgi:Xaa-Pro aminopeptidase
MRSVLEQAGWAAIRLKGADWFSWATAGGSNVVLLTSEIGVAELLITRTEAWLITSPIEGVRLREEEVGPEYALIEVPWADIDAKEAFIRKAAGPGAIASDRPQGTELPLSRSLKEAKHRLTQPEVERYRRLGREAAQAMTEAMSLARPEWTEFELAAAGSRALWARGIHPALILVAGEQRVEKYRHPLPTAARLGRSAMMVFCARQFGLYANLTRFVYFERMTASEQRRHADVARVEAAALEASIPGEPISVIFERMRHRYEHLGYLEEYLKHHQGGTTGYLAREALAHPGASEVLQDSQAVAWNPSLPGAKIEDTFLVTSRGLERLTTDADWPFRELEGRARPVPWERSSWS